MAVKKYSKIWILQLKNGLMQRMAFKENFFFLSIAVFLQLVLIVTFAKVIFGFFDNIAGWSFEQVMVIIASYVIIEGLLWATCGYLSGMDDNIRRGRLDQFLVKPIDVQFSISVGRADPEDWIRVITGFILLFVSIQGLGFSSGFLLNLLFYLITMINSLLIIYGLLLAVKTLLFWLINAHSLRYLVENVTRMSQYPTDIFFHRSVRILFSTVIPIAFIATVPAKILIHGPKLDLIFYSCLLAVVFFIGSRKFFLYGLKHYSSASS